MPISPDSLRQELDSAERKLKQARQKREEAEREEKQIETERDAYRVLLGLQEKTPTQPSLITTENEEPQEGDQTSGVVSQRSRIRQALRDAGPRGLAPAEVFKVVRDAGVKRNYVHSTLFRWKETGVVVEKNGKYSLTQVQ